MSSIAVRPGRSGDRAFVLEAAQRLGEFDVPRGRRPDEIVAGEIRTLLAHFADAAPGAALRIAETESGEPLGFAYLETPVDYFTGRPHAHLGILAVAREAQGRGAAGALLADAEAWAKSGGHDRITLNVFAANRHARAVYEHRGFEAETLRYVKTL